jgi:hypothetical protein
MLGAIIGVSFVLIYAWKHKVFLPAIPSILFGILISIAAALGVLFLRML